MEGSRRNGLSLPRLLLLLPFLVSPLPSSYSQAETRKCFICSSLTSSKCEGALSSSDTEFIKECPTSPLPDSTDLFTASGCIVLAFPTHDYVHPSGRPVWRDCLYSMDFDLKRDYVSPNPPWSKGHSEWGTTVPWYPGQKSTFVPDFNERRKSKGLSTIAPLSTEYKIEDVTIVLQHYLHPKPEHWTLSNGAAAKALFPQWFEDISPMRSVKCYVCTHDDPGCEGDLSSSSTHLIQDCVGSVETTVPVGCQILAGQFEYPHKTYFFRGCLYQNYLGCYMKRSGISIVDPDDKWSINFPDRVGCLNKVRNYLGLQDYDTGFPAWRANSATRLYIVPGEREPSWFKDKWTIAYANRGNLSNGVAIEGLISKQANPTDFKINGNFTCHTCDTQTGYCGGDKGEKISDLPQEQCMTHEDAFGCMTMYSYSTSIWEWVNFQTRWMRRGCWYKGDLFCLKSLQMPNSPGRSGGAVCPPPKKKCNARKLITEGKTVYWEGERTLNQWNWNREWHEEVRACLRKNRLRLGVNESLPELPDYDDALPEVESGSGFMYSFCAGRTLCNDKKTPNVDKQEIIKPITTTSSSITSTSTTTVAPPPTTTTTSGGGGECDPDLPDDEVDIEDCESEGPNYGDKGGWFTSTKVLVGIATLALVLLGAGLCKRRRERGRRDGGQPMQQGHSQFNPNGTAVNYPPGQQALSQLNSDGSVAATSSAQLPADSNDLVGA